MAQYPAVIDLGALDGVTGFRIDGAVVADYFGYSVSAADINGDGFADLFLTATRADPNGVNNAGAGYVIYGSAQGFAAHFDISTLNGSNGFTLNGIAANGKMGSAFTSAGDLNNDGLPDFILGAPLTSPGGQQFAGSAYIVFGAAGGVPSTTDLSAIDGTNGFVFNGVGTIAEAGRNVLPAGDVNGDGIADLIISAEGATVGGQPNAGQAYVVFGHAGAFSPALSPSDLDGSNGFSITGQNGPNGANLLGSAIAVGDVNGDGLSDVIVSTYPQGGRAYVIFGRHSAFPANVTASAALGPAGTGFILLSDEVFPAFAASLATTDFNGDGIDDLVIGSPAANGDATKSGVTYVVYGNVGPTNGVDVSTMNATQGFKISGINAQDGAGTKVADAGDVNGDGFGDIVISDNADHVYVVFGAASGIPANVHLSGLNGMNGFMLLVPPNVPGSPTQHAVSSGDVNGDGLSDIIVGSSFASTNGSHSGSAYVLYGREPDTAVTRTGTEAGQNLVGGEQGDTLNGLGGNDKLYGNGGNDTLNGGNGDDILHPGTGNDTLNGDDGNDGFAMGANYTAADHIDGGAGTNDQIQLDGDYSGGVTLSAASIVNVEAMALAPGHNYTLTTADDFVAALQTFTFWSVSMTSANHATIDASAETNGSFKFFMGQGADAVIGGAGNDLFYGEGGGDTLTGGGGSDIFAYLSPSDSTGDQSATAFDHLPDFVAGTDKFKLPSTVTGIDSAVTTGSLSIGTFNDDLVAAIDGSKLAIAHAVLFTPDAGTFAATPHTFLVVDANGAAGYQAGLDFVFDVTGGTLTGLSTADFFTT